MEFPALDLHCSPLAIAPNNRPARYQLDRLQVIKANRPVDLNLHRATSGKPLMDREQDTLAAHVQCLAGARQGGAFATDSVLNMLLNWEALRLAPLLGRCHANDENTLAAACTSYESSIQSQEIGPVPAPSHGTPLLSIRVLLEHAPHWHDLHRFRLQVDLESLHQLVLL